MDTIFTLGNDVDGDVKVNLDDLYERKIQQSSSVGLLFQR